MCLCLHREHTIPAQDCDFFFEEHDDVDDLEDPLPEEDPQELPPNRPLTSRGRSREKSSRASRRPMTEEGCVPESVDTQSSAAIMQGIG